VAPVVCGPVPTVGLLYAFPLRVRPFLVMRNPRLLLLALALWVPARPISYIREQPKRGATLISALQCSTATTHRKNSSLHFELQKVMFAQRAWLPRAQSTALLQFGLSQERDMITFLSEVCASATLPLPTSLKRACAFFMGVLQGFEADVVGPALLMTHHGRNKFEGFTGS
jgi:hypothetical protein